MIELLKKFWNTWKKFGQILGDFLARIVLTLFYFTIFLPFGLIVRLASDPLALKDRSAQMWLSRTTTNKTLDDVRRMS